MIEITQLFSVPLYKSKVDITSSDLYNIQNIKYTRTPSDNGYVSDNFYLLDDAVFINLKTRILQHIANLCDILKVQENIQFYITNSWAISHKAGDSAPIHHHNNSLISGVVYVKCDKNSGSIGFKKSDQTVTIFPPAIDVKFKEENLLNANYYEILPTPGDIILFPSFLEHYVSKSFSNEPRYVISFNVFIKGTLGSSINVLNLP
jgi:uncharacterized protein (TIGR02466 family)